MTAQPLRVTHSCMSCHSTWDGEHPGVVKDAPLGIFSSTKYGQFISINKEMARMFGYDSPQDMMNVVTDIGQQLYVDPTHREQVIREIETAVAYTLAFDCQYKRKDGSIFWANNIIKAVRHNNEVVYYQCYIHDISWRMELECKLARTAQRYLNMYNRASDGIVQMHPVYGILSASPTMISVLGYDSLDSMAAQIKDISQHLFADPNEYKLFYDMIQQGSVTGYEFRAIKNGGDTIWLSISAHKEYDVDVYEDEYIEGYCQNVTARKLEEDIRIKLREQADRVQYQEALALLTGGIIHDFNNLLMGIQGNVSLLLNELASVSQDIPPSCKDRLRNIENSIDSASDLARQLLDCSNYNADDSVALLNPGHVVKSVASMFKRTQKIVSFKTIVADDIYNVQMKYSDLERILINLCVNAADAHGNTVTISVRNHIIDDTTGDACPLPPGAYIQLCVCDNGIGIDTAVLPRIFEPYYTTKERGKGTGLGLPSVRSIVDNMGGHIIVESTQGQGASFTIYLPAAPQQPIEIAPSVAPQTEQNLLKNSGTGMVLVVDDELIVRKGCDYQYAQVSWL